jgi:hypothetical protein
MKHKEDNSLEMTSMEVETLAVNSVHDAMHTMQSLCGRQAVRGAGSQVTVRAGKM